MPSHALLLRLFLSPSFFSVHVALHYLQLYADNIGITYYLTRRLKSLDTHELRDVWGFICHLLVSRPTKSRALEGFVVEISQRSTHIAMITLWFMQATLKDLSSSSHNSQSFLICQRVLHKCHEIIFSDLDAPTSAPYSSLRLPLRVRLPRRKLRPHFEPTITGLGLILAGLGLPQLTGIMSEVVLEQGCADIDGLDARVQAIEGRESGVITLHRSIQTEETREQDELSEQDDEDGPSLQGNGDIFNQKSLGAGRRLVDAAQTVPALPLHLKELRQSRASSDPLGQLDAESSISQYQSSPSIPSTSGPHTRLPLQETPERLLNQYDLYAQCLLLRSHYCRSEVQFILSLESICNRLLVVPRAARVSALRAELTALNHKLPAEVCMPMWCGSYDQTKDGEAHGNPHHRIVRIPPGESVVLNSAERAPYLLLIEILNEDLDFDPNRRSNKEVLKKIIATTSQQKNSLNPFSRTSNLSSQVDDLDLSKIKQDYASEPVVIPATPIDSYTDGKYCEEAEVEIDLVEQLYGTDNPVSSRSVDLSETFVLPPAPKNKELELVAWSRSTSASPSPTIGGNLVSQIPSNASSPNPKSSFNGRSLSLDEYSDRMRTAAIMLAQLNASSGREFMSLTPTKLIPDASSALARTWSTGASWLSGGSPDVTAKGPLHPSLVPSETYTQQNRLRIPAVEAATIRERIMKEMNFLEEERMERTRVDRGEEHILRMSAASGSMKSLEDENIIRRELNKVDPSAIVFSESWSTKKARIRAASPYGHLANWDCVSVIVKTGGDLRQEQLAVQLIREFQRIWEEEECACWVRYFRILITGGTSGLVETITDAVSIHSIKKAEYARRLTEGRLGHVTLMDHFRNTYGDPSSVKFVRAQRNFAKSLAGYSIVTYILQIKDRHNGNILLDRDGHLVHIDFGFILSNSPGNIGFEAAPFKLPPEYVEVLGGVNGSAFLEFKRLFREGFETARKHCDRIITLVDLMQKDSTMPCFAAFGDQTASFLRERFQPALTHSSIGEYVDRLIDTSLGSHWTRLYDSFQYYSQSIL